MLCDTSGWSIYHKHSQACAPFDRMLHWKNELISPQGEEIKLMVVGNKGDVQGKPIAEANGARYFDVSARSRTEK
jgi:hypothetical protein